jgi:DNA-binding helix-hairpin-helix protein with protein kinase domain
MKIFIKGKGELTLTQNDFLASGGEASVYKKGNKAYKIYTDINKMISVSKIQELAVLNDPHIIKPQDILLNSKNELIGYNMELVPKSYSICQLFTKAFRQREHLEHPTMFELIKKCKIS